MATFASHAPCQESLEAQRYRSIEEALKNPESMLPHTHLGWCLTDLERHESGVRVSNKAFVYVPKIEITVNITSLRNSIRSKVTPFSRRAYKGCKDRFRRPER